MSLDIIFDAHGIGEFGRPTSTSSDEDNGSSNSSGVLALAGVKMKPCPHDLCWQELEEEDNTGRRRM